MAVGGDDRSANRNYPVPTPGNWLSEDMARLITALQAIDVDVTGLLTAVAARALLIHSHSISQVMGLQDALDGKQNVGAVTITLDDLTDVNVTGAAALQVLMKSAGSGWVAGIIDAANLSGWTAKLASSSIDAGQILTGTLDPARIPVLQQFTPVVSTGDLTALTSGQLATIVTGSLVFVTDGRRLVYKGSGSKTADASYIELVDASPDWGVIANKPFFGTSSGYDLATIAQYRAAAANKMLDAALVWAAAGAPQLTDASTIPLDFSTGFNFYVTLGGNRTLGTPTNMKTGQTGSISIFQDGAGSRTLSFSSAWKFGGGIAPTLSTPANSWDKLYYVVEDASASKIHASLVKGIA